MKIFHYLNLILAVTLLASCEQHEIKYDAESIADMAEFQIHYMAPVTSVAANNITRVDVNGTLIANNKAPLNTYNAVPSGAVGRFYAAAPGSTNLKLYLTGKVNVDSLVYDQNVTLNTGKQNIFVHAFDKPPVIFNNGYPYVRNVTEFTDSAAWIKFYNFLYETAGVPTTKKIQYQYVDIRTNTNVNIGPAIGFGETTGWVKVKVIKTDIISAGSQTITFKMKETDASGNPTGDLMIMNTSGTYVAYSGTATLNIGRWYHQIMAGFRAVKAPNSSVRTFSAL